jgi:hypothetical protein
MISYNSNNLSFFNNQQLLNAQLAQKNCTMQAVANSSIQVGHDCIIWNSIPSEIHKASTISENSANLRHHNELNGCSFLEERDAVSSLSSNDSTHI